jgi:hypothetical protein
MTDLLMDLINALGGWEIMVRAGAVVALSSLILAAFKHPNAFVKRGTGFVSAAVIALLWVGPGEQFGRELVKNWFAGTILWSIALKPMINKAIESWRPSGPGNTNTGQ